MATIKLPSGETLDIPAFAFYEAEDGTITWGSSWEPGPSVDHEPIVVEYAQAKSGLWVPRQAWVRGRSGIDMHDCDWIESRGELYHHDAGSDDPYVSGWSEPERFPGRIWIAAGVVVTGPGKRPLSDDDLLARGIRRVHGPTPAPFADALEGGVFWCEICEDYIPDEDDDITDCCCCSEPHHMHKGDLIAVVDEDEAELDEPGVYRTTRWPFYTPGLLGSGYLHESALVRVADPPSDLRMDGYAAGSLCRFCAARILADRGLPILASEWSEDREAMDASRREALLDAVRSRVEQRLRDTSQELAARVHEYFAPELATRFGLQQHEMRMLCEEAGYP